MKGGFVDARAVYLHRLTWASPGFMGKSQMIEFIREVHSLFAPGISDQADSSGEQQPLLRAVSFEMFHRVALKLQYSIGRRHSRILWALCSAQLARENGQVENVSQFLDSNAVCRFLPDIYLQGVDAQGVVYNSRPMWLVGRSGQYGG